MQSYFTHRRAPSLDRQLGHVIRRAVTCRSPIVLRAIAIVALDRGMPAVAARAEAGLRYLETDQIERAVGGERHEH